MYWGQAPNKRFGHSGDNVRHLVKMGRLGGGEYRDPHFLFDFASQTFRDLSESCCTAMLVYTLIAAYIFTLSYTHTHNTHTHTHSLTHSLTHSHTLTHTHRYRP